jgi:general secretion pathway protein G
MARRRARERTVFLPWERQGNILRRVGLARVRPFVLGVLVLGVLLLLVVRERQRARVRSTRATILVARRAVDSYRADHEGNCPKGGLDEVVAGGYLGGVPRDAWRHPLRLVCPARRPEKPYELLSDGPDGEPGGLDRVE